MNRPLAAPRTPASQPGAEPQLRVVTGTQRSLVRIVLTVGIVLLALLTSLFCFGLVQSLVTEAQGRIDQLNGQIDEATIQDRDLRLRRAELLAPARLRDSAANRLGMVTPTTIVYLVPSQPSAP